LHLYDHGRLVAIHDVTQRKLNYAEEHYVELLSKALPFGEDRLREIAKENLKRIEERYIDGNDIPATYKKP